MLARIPADVSKRLFILACAAAIITAACSDIPEGEVVTGTGPRFVVAVADAVDDVGLGNAVSVDPDGNPVYSYLIFPAELGPNEIPAARPIGAPYIQTASTAEVPGDFGAAVGVGSVSADGIFTRGAAAQVRDTPSGITVPYGPATVDALVGADAGSMNGTDIAVDEGGGKHVVWAGNDGIYYAGGTDSFSAELLFDYGIPLRKAGPIGRPGVTIDADGAPWVAYTVNALGERVEVAINDGERWRTEVVAELAQCAGCPQPKRTEIGVTSAGPVVAYIDTASGEAMAAVRGGNGNWTSSPIAPGVEADGLGMTVDAEGTGYISFYDLEGSAMLAVQDGDSWTVNEVAAADLAADADGTANLAPTTGVAVDERGAIYVTFMNAGTIGLVSSPDGGSFAPVETNVLGGSFPAVAVTPDGARVYVTWYDDEGHLLKLGIQGDLEDVQVAVPSPTSEPAPPTTGGDECGTDANPILDLVTSGGIVFDSNCLVAPAGDPFTITYDNEAAGIPHNVNVFTEQGGDSLGATELTPGPDTQELDLEPLDEGSYYFQCDAHPTQMFGTLAVVKTKGK
jgi:plastocyanin